MSNIQNLSDAVDAASIELLAEGRRTHIGPSSLNGDECERQIWYSYRWYTSEKNNGSLPRLRRRGHDEEHRVVKWLRAAGMEVRDYAERLLHHPESDSYVTYDWDVDWSGGEGHTLVDVSEEELHIKLATVRGEAPKQWGFKELDGHYAGSCDGRIKGVDLWIPEAEGWGLWECKTSNEKSFVELAGKKAKWDFNLKCWGPREFNPLKNGLFNSKREHWYQMQQYMRRQDLPWGLYTAVNKETDEIYYEFVRCQPEIGDRMFDLARDMVVRDKPPKRKYRSETNFKCRICEHPDKCFDDAAPDMNCRSCTFCSPHRDGNFECKLFKSLIPKNFLPKGCEQWREMDND